MPVLGVLLVSLFTGLAEFFAKWVTRKIAAAASAIAVFATLTAALFVTLSAAAATLVWALPGDSALMTGIWLAVPDNGPLCVAAALSCDAVVAVYRMNVANVQFAVYAP